VTPPPKLNFPPYRFRVTDGSGAVRIWDTVRRAWLPLTPEEWVRQHTVRYLVEVCGAVPAMIVEECPVAIGSLRQRADIVVFDSARRPVVLVECKAPEVDVDEAVFAQAVRYNSVLGARYVVVTNGLRHCVRRLGTDGRYESMAEFPRL
jgi:type I site-specific restriction endonuclease